MKDAFIIHNDPSVENLVNSKNITGININFIDEGTLKGKKEAYKIKSKFAARMTPFIGIIEDGEIQKGFYSEASNNVIKDFIDWYGKIEG